MTEGENGGMIIRYSAFRDAIAGTEFAIYEDGKPVLYDTPGEAERALADSWGHLLGRVNDPLDAYDLEQFRSDIDAEWTDILLVDPDSGAMVLATGERIGA